MDERSSRSSRVSACSLALVCALSAGCSAKAAEATFVASGGAASNAAGAGGSPSAGAGTVSAGGAVTSNPSGASGNSGSAGAPSSTGGASGGSSTAAGNGGSAGESAGGAAAIGSGGAASGGASAACPGIAITPDAMGLVAAGSNTLGIHGSWFEYSDCADLKNVNCSTVTTPAANSFANVGGKMCTSGHTSTSASAWGAGIGLELNDGPPQMPYDTSAHGVKGFCFVLSGAAIPSTTIRVAFPTKDNNDNAYFSAVSTLGQHTVLFSDTAQGSWVTQASAFEPTAVMLLQFQIPASSGVVVPWDFCIEGLTAIVE